MDSVPLDGRGHTTYREAQLGAHNPDLITGKTPDKQQMTNTLVLKRGKLRLFFKIVNVI